MANKDSTMVRVKAPTKVDLEQLKTIEEETIDSVVRRLIRYYRSRGKVSK